MFNTHHVPSTLFEKRNGFLQGLYYQKYTRPHQYFTESIIFVTIIRGDIGSGSYKFQRFCMTQSQPPDPMSPGTTIRFFSAKTLSPHPNLSVQRAYTLKLV